MRNITDGKVEARYLSGVSITHQHEWTKKTLRDPNFTALKFYTSPYFTSSKRYWKLSSPLAISGKQPVILRWDALSLAGAALMTVPADERHLAKSSICVTIH